MSQCNQCVKINPLPECIEGVAYNPYYLENLNFADGDTNMIAKIKDIATNKVTYISFTTDADGDAIIDIYELFPMMDHTYTIDFFNQETGNPEHFTITNFDGTTSTGCCVEFNINTGMVDVNGFFFASSQSCQV